MVREQAQRLGVAACGEELEGTDAHMARGDARQNGAGQLAVAPDRLAGGDGGQRTRRGDAERSHRLAHDVFTQHRPDRGAAIAAAREGRRARALELDVAAPAVAVHDLAQQDGAAVAQLRHEVAELVTGIGERDRLGTRRHAVARQYRHTLGGRERSGIEAELQSERLIQFHQPRRRHRRGRQPGIEPLRQPRVAVVERQTRQGVHVATRRNGRW